MNQDLLNEANEFATSFIGTFPNVEHPVKRISDLNTALNAHAQQTSEHGEIINAITILLSNSALEAFAATDSQANGEADKERTTASGAPEQERSNPADQTDNGVIAEARKVIDGGGDLAGLRELVSKLIADLEADHR